jgi:hypothetical protein
MISQEQGNLILFRWWPSSFGMQEPRHYRWGHVAAAVILHTGPAAYSVLSLALEDSQLSDPFEARTEAHQSATSVRLPRKSSNGESRRRW